MSNDRAERAVLSHAEAYRLVEEAQEQRARAVAAEAENAELRAALIERRSVTWGLPEIHEVDVCHVCSAYAPAPTALVHEPGCFFNRELGQRGAEILEAGDAMAAAIGDILAGGVEMKPTADGPVTFEAMLHRLQMLRATADLWRELRAAVRA